MSVLEAIKSMDEKSMMTSFEEIKPELATMAVQTLVIETQSKAEQVNLATMALKALF